ncbi:MAG: hypothetical protein CL927_12240 [Deltaproteobacteria bacterium]|nr:hypothetical protein [Deltaproteobacteria bacterium]
MWRGRPVVAATRLLLGLLLVAAHADPSWTREQETDRVVYLVDTSSSIPKSSQAQVWSAVEKHRATLPPTARWAAVQVDGTARLLAPFTDGTGTLPAPLAASARASTAMLDGLRRAGSLLPTGTPGRIVLYTDGQFDASPMTAELNALAARGVAIEVAVPTLPMAPADIRALTLPPAADVGSTIEGTLTLWSGPGGLSTDVQFELMAPDGTIHPLDPVELSVPAGRQADVALAFPLDTELPSGLYKLRCTLLDTPQPPFVTGLRVDRPPRVLLVRGERRDGAVIQGVLEAEGMDVQVARASAPPALSSDFDLVILAGTPTGNGGLPAKWIQTLSSFVDEGGGLLTISGPGGYASGGWQDSGLAPLLPVRIDPDGAEKDDSASLLVVLDKSGSMARPAADARSAKGMVSGVADLMLGGRGQGSKIQVAAEAAAATMDRLRDHDRVGVLAVDTLPYWPVPMVDATARKEAQKKVRRIAAGGGGMYVLTALDAAAEAMQKEDAPLRHILLLVDASDAGEQTQDTYGSVRGALERAGELRREGITLSVVGLGGETSRDSDFLEQLTQNGGGRLKLTPDIRTVSALFTQEVERLVGSAVHEQAPIHITVTGWHAALQGLDVRNAPQIWGWSDVLPRTRARTVLSTPEGTPIFAVWRRGMGQVAAWTSDDGARWARRWPAWSQSATFWTQAARTLARDKGSDDAPLRLEPVGDQMRITLEATDDLGRPEPIGTPDLVIMLDGTPIATPTMQLAAPGRLEGTWAPPAGARLVATATTSPSTEAAIKTTAEAIVTTSSERAGFGLRPDVLDELSRTAATITQRDRSRAALWPWLAFTALLLLPLDAYARRFYSSTPPKSRAGLR